jgi:hypothetical protein
MVIFVGLVTVKQGLAGDPEHGDVEISVVSTTTWVAAKLASGALFASNPVPFTVTTFAPPVAPVLGETPVTVGTGAKT